MTSRSLWRALALCLGLVAPGACEAPNEGDASVLQTTGEVSRANGAQVFWIGGCASCHAGPGRLSTRAPDLGGGQPIRTQYGVFRGGNISPHPEDGIGNWSLADFDRAMRQGVAPDGHAYFPAFPYTSYARMTDEDISDLYAFLRSLPPVEGRVAEGDPAFPVNLPVAAKTWQRLALRSGPVVDLPNAAPEVARGQYLVEGPGHCGTCHTPRTPLGGPRYGRWLSGGEMLDGSGFAPNLTPHEDGLGDRSVEEILVTLHPFDVSETSYAGMSAARTNLARLPESDRLAIVAYLKAIPAIASVD